MRIYVCHPLTTYGEVQDNMRKATEAAWAVARTNCVPVSPLHAFSFMMGENGELVSRRVIMDNCLSLLKACDQLWAFEGWQYSKGCKQEVMFCFRNKIPVYEVKIREGVVCELREIKWKDYKRKTGGDV